MKKKTGLFILMMLGCLLLAFPVSAKWVEKEDGSFVYEGKKKNAQTVEYFPELKMGIIRSGKYCYCYTNKDKKVTGLVKNGSDWYYFMPKKGRMAIKKRIRIEKKYYYFGTDGKRVRSTWVGKRYYGKNGKQVFSKFVDDRYIGSKGKYLKGLQKIDGYYYYFDKKTGIMLKDCRKTIKKKVFVFNSEGKGKLSVTDGVEVEDTYFTDPEVSDEKLLAAIIYTEAGNQPYSGQLAVGIVITNRIRSREFPNKLKEVIYAKWQFEPARNGMLTAALKGKMPVSESCEKAAAEALSMYKNNIYKITNAKGKKVSMKNYLFFMTPGSYTRLGLKSKKRVLWDHVFFKEWK